MPAPPTAQEAATSQIHAIAPVTVSVHQGSVILTPPTLASLPAMKVRAMVTIPTTASVLTAQSANLGTVILPLRPASRLATPQDSHMRTRASAPRTVSVYLGTAPTTPVSLRASPCTRPGATRTVAIVMMIQNANLLTAPLMPVPRTAPRTPLWAATQKAASAPGTTNAPSKNARMAPASPAATSSSWLLEATSTSVSAQKTPSASQASATRELASLAAS
mmetsp:Transcript_22679/g.21856  ORF Transcript_22679/g.21856 Transcript_22679/m.21856 type:complete len:220 (+) Transcript_22679:2426-3085(+)